MFGKYKREKPEGKQQEKEENKCKAETIHET